MAIKLTRSLKNRRILITAGPTWVPIDSVRVISNTATGKTGILLAEKLSKQGAKVTLLLGPADSCCINKRIRLIRFKFFDDLKKLIEIELMGKKYEAVIHSAAVSDYRPKINYRRKVKSGLAEWNLKLKSTPKIIDSIKNIDSSVFLVGFKFEPEAKIGSLIEKAKKLLGRAKSDLVVANTVNKGKYRAYIINQDKVLGPFFSKRKLIERLICLV